VNKRGFAGGYWVAVDGLGVGTGGGRGWAAGGGVGRFHRAVFALEL
jgi:hypothetical protein